MLNPIPVQGTKTISRIPYMALSYLYQLYKWPCCAQRHKEIALYKEYIARCSHDILMNGNHCVRLWEYMSMPFRNSESNRKICTSFSLYLNKSYYSMKFGKGTHPGDGLGLLPAVGSSDPNTPLGICPLLYIILKLHVSFPTSLGGLLGRGTLSDAPFYPIA